MAIYPFCGDALVARPRGDFHIHRSHGVLHVATAVGLPLSAYIVAASVYFATTIPYASDFFCDG